MNTNQTIDERCSMLAQHAFGQAYLRGDLARKLDCRSRQRIAAQVRDYANRIIALRTLEAAQQAQAVRS